MLDCSISIPELFRAQVARHPDCLAIKAEERVISYDGLDRWSNQIAQAILDRLGPDNRTVALLLPHGAGPIAGLIAAFKAGKVVVPLDATVAVDRIRLVLEHSECALILVDESSRAAAEAFGATPGQLLDLGECRSYPEEAPDLDVSPESLAVLYYTSGSTGCPKGVMHTHRSVLANVRCNSQLTGITHEDRATVLFTFAAASAVAESLHGLLNGACLFPYDVRNEGLATLGEWLLQEEISIFQWFPSGFRRFAETLSPESHFPHIRRLMFAGEPLSRTEVEIFRRYFSSDCRLIDRMGSTETGTLCALILDHTAPMGSACAAYGYPVPSASICLLNQDGSPVPQGEAGIIHGAGPAVAKGYWRDPELTRSAFLELAGQPEMRRYTTGDLGRFREDGSLEYLGRGDRQIKIHGYRVEPAELEAALRELPEVREAVVLARQDPRGQQHLIAYFQIAGGVRVEEADLRNRLARRLPPFLLPSHFFEVAQMPVTATGKLDPAGLPDPRWDEAPLTEVGEAASPLEELISRTWCDVLRLEQVGRRTSYFALGGDSLQAALIAGRLQRALPVAVSAGMVLQYPTISDLAEALVAAAPALAEYSPTNQTERTDAARSGLSEWLRDLDGSAQPLVLPEPWRQSVQAPPGGTQHTPTSIDPRASDDFLLAGLATLLHRYCDQDRFCIGLLESGSMENWLLPLPVDFQEDPAFSSVAAQIRESLETGRRRGGIALSEAEASLAQPAVPLPSFLQVIVRVDGSELPESLAADLCVIHHPETGGLACSSPSRRLEHSLVERLPGHLSTLLAGALETPDVPIGTLPLLTPAERHRTLIEWACGADAPTVQECIHQLIEQRVALTPERIALRGEGGTLTYAEMNARANRLARWLREQGASPGARIALFLPQSADAIIAVLAVLKSGAAYVGLPLSSPAEQLGLLLQDCQPLLVLTHLELSQRLQSNAVPVFHLDGSSIELAAYPDHDPTNLNGPDDDAFVLFTSGSTGMPKAVLGTHRGTVNRRNWWVKTYPPDDGVKVTCLRAAVSVLPFVLQLFWPLSIGATVLITSQEDSADPTRLLALASQYGVTHMATPSSLMIAMLEVAPDLNERMPHLRQWQCGAEVLPPEQARRFHALLPGRRLVLAYGSTETSAGFTWFDTLGLTEQHTRVPVGRPIPNCQIYVLDRYRQPVPVGVRGEVYVGGECLTRGYLNRPELTAERFVPNPLPEGRSERLYRMGDLGRFLPDGNLELHGRVDHQVKVRGFRIELAEIEAVLVRHPMVREAVVVVRNFGDDPRLVAYFAPVSGAAELRTFVKEALPQYMVPAVFVALPSLPRLPSGKVDRRSLPDPKQFRPEGEAPLQAPQGDLEVAIARIWQEVLRMPHVGREDAFFDLGGHSLLVMRVVSRIRESLQVNVSAAQLFQHPTVAALAAHLQVKQGATDAANRPAREEPVRLPVPGTRQDGASVPLSFAQQRLWFLDQLEPDSATFNEPTFLRLQGSLDVESLERALNEIVRRHAVLRSRYPAPDGEPVLETVAPFHLPLPLTDLSTAPEAEASGRLQELLREETEIPFSLAEGPVLRARLFRLDPADHLLSLVIHHIATDGWSSNVLVNELRQLYGAFRDQSPSPLSELTCQYADFATWQRREADFTNQLAYWTRKLEGAPQLEPPLDYPRPPLPRHDGAEVEVSLGPELTAAVDRLAREASATPFMLLLSAFAALLGRWTGTDDLVIGAPVTDRPFPETEGLIGIFLNNLSLRVDLSGHPSFRELLARVRTTAVEAYAHQQVPFEQVVQSLHIPRDTAPYPVFEVMCNHLSAPQASLEFSGLTVSKVRPETSPAKLAMTLYSRYVDGSLRLRLHYQRALFRPERMEACLAQLRWLLSQVTSRPDAPLEQLSLATPEAAALLSDPTVQLDGDAPLTVLEELAARATATPELPAVSWRGRTWSYRELADAADRIAGVVAGRTTRGAVVGVTGERSFGVIAALLGVLRAGAVLLTLDPALPPARRSLMLAETGCQLLLSAGEEPAAPGPGLDVISLDPSSGEIAGASGAPAALPPPERHGDAYVFFTSGSTGEPKAVLGTHAGLAHFIAWQRGSFEIGPGDRCAQLTGLSFDVLLRDLFLPLTSGATLCLPEAADLVSGANVFAWLEREAITTAHAVPSLARHWLASCAGRSALPQLRYLFLAGEPLRDDLIHWWREATAGSARLVNLYGPTETTLAKFCYPVPETPEPGLQPVGWPLPSTQALVLTSTGTRCGLYEPGEIVIRTPFRTRGYLHSPDEMQRRFRPNPVPDAAAQDLVYHTGDRGFIRADGALVVLGRMDAQFKLRGVRIEPGEVEAALLRHPAVREAAVDMRRAPRGEDVLAAYLVPAGAASAPPPDLRRFLLEQLPVALVPSVFVLVEQLPRNASGKLVRGSLPEPEFAAPGEQGFAPPRDDVERRLVWIWQELLNLRPVGIHDHFFDLGGHSLLAVQLLGRIHRTFGKELPLASLIQSATIAEIAERLRDERPHAESSVLVPLQAAGHRRPLFAVHGIGGGVLCYRTLAALLGADQPFYALQAPALAGEGTEHLSLEEMAQRYVRAIRTVQPAGPYCLLGLSFGGNIALEMAQQLIQSGEKVAFLGMLDSKGPGYPRFPGRAARVWSHVHFFLKQSGEGRRRYLAVRWKSAQDLVRRRVLRRWFLRVRTSQGALPRLLDDIGISHIQAGREYRRQPYPGTITLFQASHQPIGCVPEWDNGWSRVAREGVTVYEVPGEHAEIVEEPHVRVLAEHLQAALRRIEAAEADSDSGSPGGC